MSQVVCVRDELSMAYLVENILPRTPSWVPITAYSRNNPPFDVTVHAIFGGEHSS